jgi:enterochelin esterase-like enzyme
MQRMFRLLLCAFCLLGFSAAFGQLKSTTPTPLVLKSVMQWAYHSKTINDDFTIYVQLPAGYDTSKISYPVLYMTDADWNMTVAMNCFSMLRQDYKIIQPIIIGIGYGNGPNKRTRDLNPADGGPKFLTFIEHEVMPFVQGKYRASEGKSTVWLFVWRHVCYHDIVYSPGSV